MSRRASTDTDATHSYHVLFGSPGISVVDFRCRAHGESPGAEEPNPTHSIVLVRRGAFRRTERAETRVADPNHILLFNAGQPYRYSHPVPGGDDCTILAVAPSVALELVSRHAPRQAGQPETPFRIGGGLTSGRAARLHYDLLSLLQRSADPLAIEDALAELADEAVRAVFAGPGVRSDERPVGAGTLRRQREITEAAKLAINRQIESPPSLTEMARAFGCSPFHLSRTFHRTEGVSLRRYLSRLRVGAAADRLRSGAPDLTALALDLGYSDHSHFTHTFRREWGIPPSRFRARYLR